MRRVFPGGWLRIVLQYEWDYDTDKMGRTSFVSLRMENPQPRTNTTSFEIYRLYSH